MAKDLVCDMEVDEKNRQVEDNIQRKNLLLLRTRMQKRVRRKPPKIHQQLITLKALSPFPCPNDENEVKNVISILSLRLSLK